MEGEGGAKEEKMETEIATSGVGEQFTLRGLVDVFLCSEAFLEMKRLHVLLLTRCLERGKVKKYILS